MIKGWPRYPIGGDRAWNQEAEHVEKWPGKMVRQWRLKFLYCIELRREVSHAVLGKWLSNANTIRRGKKAASRGRRRIAYWRTPQIQDPTPNVPIGTGDTGEGKVATVPRAAHLGRETVGGFQTVLTQQSLARTEYLRRSHRRGTAIIRPDPQQQQSPSMLHKSAPSA